MNVTLNWSLKLKCLTVTQGAAASKTATFSRSELLNSNYFSVFRIPVTRAGGRDSDISSFICVFDNLLARPQPHDQKRNNSDLKYRTHEYFLNICVFKCDPEGSQSQKTAAVYFKCKIFRVGRSHYFLFFKSPWQAQA